MSISYSASTTVAANPSIGDMNGANGTNGHAFGGKGAPSPSGGRGGSYRHINDLTRQPEPDLSRPISKLLDQAESDAKQAKFLADVGRIDAALEAYVRSFSLLVKDIRNHREFPSLQTERKAVHDRYNRLTGQVGKDFEAFEKIKQIIQEDNARTGVQPSGSMPQRAGDGPLNSRPQTPQTPKSGVETSRTVSLGVISPSPGKAKPAVNPKPANLHGNAIKPQSPRKDGAPAETDELKQRLANLRKSNVPPVQDPRIRTRPIPVSLPAASSSPTRDNLPSVQSLGRPSSPPRSVPQSPPRLTTSIDGVIGQLPKVPAAIYSPARGNMSTEAANLPSSTPRGMYSRSNSSAGFYPVKNNSANITKSPVSDDYFSPTGQRPSSVPPRPNRVPLPDGDTISVEELLKYQRTEHFRVLLIDVRPRSDFEDGHILSSATICIEPEIIERPRIEASDVEDSMEIGSAEEKRHFERRYDFDMVVIYDQDSQSPGLGRNRAAAKLFSILKDFDYPEGDPASKHPKLLRGGLDAWQDSMGGSALQNKSHKRRKSTYDKPWLKSPTKPIQSAEEARRWEQHLTQPENGGDETPEDDDDFTPVRNINEFLDFNVRYPPVQESMTSPVPSQIERWHSPVLPASPQRSEYPIIPSEPTRPPPAVPRRSFTGLQPSDDDQGTSAKIVARNDAASRRRAMGLSNPGNWCYANSTLQALFASGGFGEELFTSAWQNLYKPPKKDDEKIMPPQLLTKIMSNLFLWMGTGKFNTMQADTLMGYLRHITSSGFKGPQPIDQILGGNRQMDAHELLLRLFLELHDETNRRRDRPDVNLPPPSSDKSILEGAVDIWNIYSQANDSIIDKYWQTLECLITRCDTCQHVAYRVDPPKNHLVLSLPETSQPQSIEGLLNNYFAPEILDDYKCDGCGLKGTCRRTPRFARLPDLLCVFFGRFENKLRKNTVYIDFPHRDLDLTPWTIQGGQPPRHNSLLTGPKTKADPPPPPPSPPPKIAINDHHFTKPFKYDAYAVIQHGGQLMGGHYVAVIRDGPEGADGKSTWRVADDSRLSTHEVGPGRNDPGTKFLFRQNRHWSTAMDAYMVFYQRKDVGMV